MRLPAAITLALLISLVCFALLGGFIPIWIMDAIYGAERVEESPGGGGAIVIATIPIAGVVCAAEFVFLVLFFRKKFSRQR